MISLQVSANRAQAASDKRAIADHETLIALHAMAKQQLDILQAQDSVLAILNNFASKDMPGRQQEIQHDRQPDPGGRRRPVAARRILMGTKLLVLSAPAMCTPLLSYSECADAMRGALTALAAAGPSSRCAPSWLRTARQAWWR